MTESADHARPRIDVCVVTFNHEHYIADCLLSVLAQDVNADVRVLVGDDESSDDTQRIVEELVSRFPEKVLYFRRNVRLGPVENHRDLIQRTEADFIAHLDGDDVWLPGKLRAQLLLLELHPSCSAVCTNALVFDGAGGPVGFFSNAKFATVGMDVLLERGNFLNHSSLLYRAEHRHRVLALPPPFVDYRIHIALCRSGSIAYTASALVGYRYNASGSVIRNTNEIVREQYWEAVCDGLNDVGDQVRASACADFMRRVAFRSIRTRDIGLWRRWWARVDGEIGPRRGFFYITLMRNLLRESVFQIFAGLVGSVTNSRCRTLYFR